MSSDKDFEDMLEGLEIVTESLEEESHTVLPRVDQLKRRRTLLTLQSELFDSCNFEILSRNYTFCTILFIPL